MIDIKVIGTILVVWTVYSFMRPFIITQRLTSYMAKEEKKVVLYKETVHITNAYYKLLINDNLKNYPRIKKYLESFDKITERKNLEINPEYISIISSRIEDLNNSNMNFVREFNNSPQTIKHMVLESLELVDDLLEFNSPQIYKLYRNRRFHIIQPIITILTRMSLSNSRYLNTLRKIDNIITFKNMLV